MNLLLKLAWRNIWRNKRRSLLTLFAVTFATFASIAMRGIQLGTYEITINHAVNLFSGPIQIQKNGYRDKPSLNTNFRISEDILSAVNSTPGVTAFSERIYAQGLISFKDNSLGAAIFGINPESERDVTTFMERITNGKFFHSDSSLEVVVGYKLIENLKAEIGDEVVILSQGADGSLGNLKFKIVGTIKSGSSEFDGMAVFMGLKTADELLAMYDRIHAIAIAIPGLNNLNEIRDELDSKIRDANLSVLTWEEIMPDLKQSIEFDNVSGIFYLFILIVIVAFGILNTVLMSVTERFNEFGVTLSIGMPQVKLVHLILIETVFLTVFGIIIGNIIGWFINYYFILNPIEFTGELAQIYEEYGFLPVMTSTLRASSFFNTSLSILAISILSALYPAYKVYKLEPLKGIRYT